MRLSHDGEQNDEDSETGIRPSFQGAGSQARQVWSSDKRGWEGAGPIEQILRNWVKAAGVGKLNKAGGKVVTPEQMELYRLWAENIRLKRECEILSRTSRNQNVGRA